MPIFKTSRGLDWHYETSGNGHPMVLIHGLGGSARWWQAQQEYLNDGYHMIAVDLPGHGQSAWMPTTLKEMATELQELLRSLGIIQTDVLASSFGGLVAFELYRLMPDDVMRISFVGAIPKFARGPSYPAGLDIDKIRTLSNQFDGDYGSILDIFFRSLFNRQERESQRFQWVKQLRASEPLPQREALKAFLDILEKTDFRDRLASTICPLQFITGSDDYICPAPIMEWVAEHAVNARFDVIEACGHLPFLTKPDAYNGLLQDFLIN